MKYRFYTHTHTHTIWCYLRLPQWMSWSQSWQFTVLMPVTEGWSHLRIFSVSSLTFITIHISNNWKVERQNDSHTLVLHEIWLRTIQPKQTYILENKCVEFINLGSSEGQICPQGQMSKFSHLHNNTVIFLRVVKEILLLLRLSNSFRICWMKLVEDMVLVIL